MSTSRARDELSWQTEARINFKVTAWPLSRMCTHHRGRLVEEITPLINRHFDIRALSLLPFSLPLAPPSLQATFTERRVTR